MHADQLLYCGIEYTNWPDWLHAFSSIYDEMNDLKDVDVSFEYKSELDSQQSTTILVHFPFQLLFYEIWFSNSIVQLNTPIKCLFPFVFLFFLFIFF
jgi:hypothetical protein